MGFPHDYLKNGVGTGYLSLSDEERFAVPLANSEEVRKFLDERGLVATRKCDPFGGQIARVRIEAFGESASEVDRTLREFAQRCDEASQATEVSHGECVIERNLVEGDGQPYSWRGRLTLHPTIGTIVTSQRAAAQLSDE